MLDEERQFFEESLTDWLGTYSEKVALVKGRALVGVYDNEGQAVNEGLRRFLCDPFLIRRVSLIPPIYSVPTVTLGIPMTDANSELGTGSKS